MATNPKTDLGFGVYASLVNGIIRLQFGDGRIFDDEIFINPEVLTQLNLYAETAWPEARRPVAPT